MGALYDDLLARLQLIDSNMSHPLASGFGGVGVLHPTIGQDLRAIVYINCLLGNQTRHGIVQTLAGFFVGEACVIIVSGVAP